jgi:PAS domain S-box-containing protein
VWIGSEPLYLAREIGRLDPKAVQLVEYPSASEVLRAYRNQAIDGMVISLDELFGLAADGMRPRVILVVDVSHGADVVVGRRGMKTMHDLKGKSVAVESGALGAYVLSRALALSGMQASDVNVVHLESNEQPGAFAKGRVDGAVTFDPYRTELLRAGATTLFDSTRIPGEIVDLVAVRSSILEERPKAIQALLAGWFGALDYMKREPNDAARRMAIRQQTTGEQFLQAQRGLRVPESRGKPAHDRRGEARARGQRPPAHGADARGEAAARGRRHRGPARAGAARADAEMRLRFPASLNVTVPLILLGFAATLSAVNLFYHAPQAERAAVDGARTRLAQEMSRLQSTLEYLVMKGELAVAQHEISVLAHNHDFTLAALTDERHVVIAATRRAWLGRQVADVLPQFDLEREEQAIRERRAGIMVEPDGNALLGYAGILMSGGAEELRPSRTGSLLLAYDLVRPKAEARALVLRQSLLWAGWVIALALGMWLVFHFLLTRRTAQLVSAAEQLAAGNLDARSGLRGPDELGRLGRAFDAMALAISTDIAERKRQDEALRVSEASYRAIFDAAEDSIFVHDVDSGAIVDVNPKACATFGYTREEFRRLDIGTLGSGERPYTHQDALELIVRAHHGQQQHIEWHGRSKDGTLRWHEVFVRGVTIGGKERVLALARDITGRKEAEAALRASEASLHQREKLAALGSLLAGVAHELNNPLSVVVARAVLLEERGDPSTQNAALKIRVAAERCARIVRTFLAMARQQKPERGPVGINDVVSAALDIAAYPLRTSSVEVSLDLAQDLPLILADADQLHQVLLNLIINAQQALQDRPAPRRVRVATRVDRAANVLRITVADSGPGIPAHLRARIFEPYFTTKPTGGGLGVGLAVSLGIVEAQGGTLTVECPGEGGAIFTVTLPVVRADASPDETLPPRRAKERQGILIVDDEEEIRDTLAEILAGAGHRVVTANTGREALQRIAAEHYDVILTDIRMPDIDGRALYREIQKRWPAQAGSVVFVTGDTLASSLREFVSETGRPVIEKPFLPSEVRRVVAELAANGVVKPPD